VRYVPLTQGQVAVVDIEDYDSLMHWNWHAHYDPHTRGFYAIRHIVVDGKKRKYGMHRQVLGMDPRDPRKPDHQNCDTLDNRRSNLRIATNSENGRNQRARPTSKSGYKGVSFRSDSGLWRARIVLHGRIVNLGNFQTPELAHGAYCRAAETLHGEFARTE
jgi:hypothetical protein